VKPRVLVIGSINMDLVVRVDRMPREGETIIGREFQTFPGGKGANQAVACARLGAQTFMAGRLGADSFGDALLENLRKDGIDTAHIARDPSASSGTAMIVVDKSGQNSIVVAPGANMRMKPSDADALDELIRRVNCVVLQLETPLEVVARALDLAQKAGVKSILDAGPAVKCPMSILKKADVVSPNEVEAQTLIGKKITTVDSAKRVAKSFLSAGVKALALKLGANGSVVATKDKLLHVPAVEVKAVDTTAAGDAFTGALALALAEGNEWLAAMRYANYAGAFAVTKPGAQPSMPTRAELQDFMSKNKLAAAK